MPTSHKLLIDQLFDEVELAQKQGLVQWYSITKNQITIQLASHLHYAKTYELFEYLKQKYNFTVFVSDTRTVVAYYR